MRLSETDPTSGFAVTVLDDLGGVQQPGCAAGAGALALMQLAVRLEIFDVSPHTETREADGARGRSLAAEAEWAAGAEWRAERAVAVIAPHHAQLQHNNNRCENAPTRERSRLQAAVLSP